ncbi:protein zyg-11 homolog B-like [Glandiceps talaboti]
MEMAADSPVPVFACLSPQTLQDICLEYISENLHRLCVLKRDADSTEGFQFRMPDTVLNMELSENLLKKLSEKKKITDKELMLFSNPNATMLKRVWLSGCNVTKQGLKAIANHRLIELDASRLKNVSLEDLLDALGKQGLEQIKKLNVGWLEVCSRGYFATHNEDYLVRELSARTKQLEHLDISMAGVETLLFLDTFKKVPLKALTVFHTSVDFSDTLLLRDIAKFKTLQHLDISMDSKSHVFVEYSADTFCKFLEQPPVVCLPQLTSLDISGNRQVKESSLKVFYDGRPQIRFLGLTQTVLCEAEFLTDDEHEDFRPNIKVTGHYTEEQIMEGLRRYTNRPTYLHQLLSYLFDKTHFLVRAQLDILQHVVNAMKTYPNSLGIQMAGSACLYNLTKYELSDGIHVSMLREVITIVLDAMTVFPEREQLQNNCMLVLRNERILHDVNFDYLRASQLTMQCLKQYSDMSMCRTASIISSILVHKLTTEQKAILGTTEVIQKLIDIISVKAEEDSVNTLLKMTMKILWSLTDELPGICTMFINEGGFDLYLHILKKFKDEAVIHKRALGVLNNVAEVKSLRPRLMSNDLLALLRQALSNTDIEVAYFACGIVALLIGDTLPWMMRIPKSEFTHILYDTVQSWGDYTGRLVAYRSFRPILSLLQCQNQSSQLWAAWTLWHTCAKRPERYCHMLQSEGGIGVLQLVLQRENCKSFPQLREVSEKVLKIVEKQQCQNKR